MFSIEKNSSDNPSPQQNTSANTGVSVRLQVRDSESSTALPLYWVHCSSEARCDEWCDVMRGGVISGEVISNNNPCWEDKVGSFVTFSPKYCFCLCSVLNPSTSNPATLWVMGLLLSCRIQRHIPAKILKAPDAYILCRQVSQFHIDLLCLNAQ